MKIPVEMTKQHWAHIIFLMREAVEEGCRYRIKHLAVDFYVKTICERCGMTEEEADEMDTPDMLDGEPT